MLRRHIVAAALATLLTLALVAHAEPVPGVEAQLAAAQKAGAPVFLLVKEPRTHGLQDMRAAAEEARRAAPHVRLVEMDRSDEANRPIVKRYGLAGVGVPMVLVLAHNGAPGGGLGVEKDAAKKLVALLPSPRKADTLLALFERKAAFVVVGRADMPTRAATLAACREAAGLLWGKAAVIEVDLDDKHEQGFLDVLSADRKATDVVVHVYGLAGRKTDALSKPTSAAALVTSAKKKAECCPGGKCG